MQNNGVVLSVDNYVPMSHTSFYNRKEQANFADYVVIMGYDEHYAGSSEAGSVASLSWVTQGVSDTLKEVPADQVILGMPFIRVYGKSHPRAVPMTQQPVPKFPQNLWHESCKRFSRHIWCNQNMAG